MIYIQTLLIATLSPAPASVEETIFTLRFAERVKNVSNVATINLVCDGTVAALQREIASLKQQLALSLHPQSLALADECIVAELAARVLALEQQECDMRLEVEARDRVIKHLKALDKARDDVAKVNSGLLESKDSDLASYAVKVRYFRPCHSPLLRAAALYSWRSCTQSWSGARDKR